MGTVVLVTAALLAIPLSLSCTQGMSLLAVAAFAILAFAPGEIFDPGFQLSVLATLGLIVFTPLFAEKLTWVPEKFLLREIAASTLGTQLAVLPLLLYQSGQLPIYALPANLITLVVVPFAMLFSLVAGLAGIFLGPLAIPLGFPAYLLLEYIISAAQIIADLPYASISIGAFNAAWMIIAYAIIFLIAARLHGNKKRQGPARASKGGFMISRRDRCRSRRRGIRRSVAAHTRATLLSARFAKSAGRFPAGPSGRTRARARRGHHQRNAQGLVLRPSEIKVSRILHIRQGRFETGRP